MIATNPVALRAFAIWWKDLERWVIPTNILLGQSLPKGWERVRIGKLVRQVTKRVKVEPEMEYKMAGVRLYGKGVFHRETVYGKAMSASQVTPLVNGALIYNRLFAWKATFAVVTPEFSDYYVSNEFPQFITDSARILPEYLYLFCTRETTIRAVNAASTGSSAVSRNRFKEEEFLNFEISLPPLVEQKSIVAHWRKTQDEIVTIRKRVVKLEAKLPLTVYQELGTPPPLAEKETEKCLVMWWKDLERWSFYYLSRATQGLLGFSKSKFPIEPLGNYLIETMNGYCIKPVAGPTPYKMLKLNALNPAGLDLTASKFIKVSDRIAERFSLRKDDILICRSNAYEYVAKCALVREDQPAYLFPDIIIRARVKPSVLPEFVAEVIQTPLGRSYFQINSRRAVGGMWKISADDILNFPLPVPPLAVQKLIVERITAGRKEIACEREAADRLAKEINAEIESLILGTKTLQES
jgi:type I restriction enzyme, S subunit